MRPMLATPGPLPPRVGDRAADWAYEVKWDGMRVIASVARDRVRLSSRTERDVTDRFPEVVEALAAGTAGARRATTVIDGEVVALDDRGIPSFGLLAPRIQGAPAAGASVQFLAFDLLMADGQDLMAQPYDDRRLALGSAAVAAGVVSVPESFDDGGALLSVTRDRGLEGVVAKRRSSPYRPGTRSIDWVKVAHRSTASYVVGGWRPGAGGLGSLLVGSPDGSDRGLRYRGAVGSGLSGPVAAALRPLLELEARSEPPFLAPAALPRDGRWCEPEIVVDVASLGTTAGGLLRQSALVRVRADLAPADLLEQGERRP